MDTALPAGISSSSAGHPVLSCIPTPTKRAPDSLSAVFLIAEINTCGNVRTAISRVAIFGTTWQSNTPLQATGYLTLAAVLLAGIKNEM